MTIPVYVLGNNSQQPVSINYQALGINDSAAGGTDVVASTSHGLLTIAPGKKVTIEQSRVNYGQIHILASQNLITVTSSFQ
jgi:uncharacterized protein YcfL